MTLTISPELAARLESLAQEQGTTAERFALQILAQRVHMIPGSEFKRLLREVGSPCGVSLPNEALSSEGLYD